MACNCGKKKRAPRQSAQTVKAQTVKVSAARVAYQRTLAELKARA